MALTSSRIRAINAVFEAGSFSAAAKRLGISQPGVAQQVRDVEEGFGVTLFDRRGNGLVATALCRQLYGITQRLQTTEAKALAILTQHSELKEGELRIGLGNAMPGMAMISDFQALYARISIKVEMGSWASIIDAVVDQRVDVGILPQIPDDGRFRRETCLHQAVVAIVHPTHPLVGARRITCRELMAHPLVFRTQHSSTQRIVDDAFRRAGLDPRPAIILDTRDGVLEAVINGLGVGFMWEHGSSRTDGFVKLRIQEMSTPLPEHIFCLARRHDKLVDLFFQSRRLQGVRTGSAPGPY
ncbi:MAG: LysR family transcriptional regulator [Proteobacteria bacterium]|nr:LysR family transcriptional regulator [Pseudomonadota bacterium]